MDDTLFSLHDRLWFLSGNPTEVKHEFEVSIKALFSNFDKPFEATIADFVALPYTQLKILDDITYPNHYTDQKRITIRGNLYELHQFLQPFYRDWEKLVASIKSEQQKCKEACDLRQEVRKLEYNLETKQQLSPEELAGQVKRRAQEAERTATLEAEIAALKAATDEKVKEIAGLQTQLSRQQSEDKAPTSVFVKSKPHKGKSEYDLDENGTPLWLKSNLGQYLVAI